MAFVSMLENKLSMNESADIEMENAWLHLKVVFEKTVLAKLKIYDDVDVVTGWALPLKRGRTLTEEHDGFGWSNFHIDHLKNRIDFEDLSSLPKIYSNDKAFDVVLSFAGGYTYGHWLLDIAPRIELILSVLKKEDLSFIVPGPLPGWAHRFLDVYEIDKSSLIELDQNDCYHSKNLVIPSFGRSTNYLPPIPHRSAFLRMRDYWLDRSTLSGPGERILVRHTPQTSAGQRSILSNFDALESRLLGMGFQSIFPAEMSWSEQISAFKDAKIVVGEDSSALHNIIFSTNSSIIVINGINRKNLLHLSIAKLLNISCNYVFCEEQDSDSFECDVDYIEELVKSKIQ